MKIYTYLLISVLGLNFYAIAENSTEAETVNNESDGLPDFDDSIFGETITKVKYKIDRKYQKVINKNKKIINLLASENPNDQKQGREKFRSLVNLSNEEKDAINKKVKYTIALNIASKIINEDLKGIKLQNIYNGFYNNNSALVDNFVKNLRKKLENTKDKKINKAEYQFLKNCIAVIKKLYCIKNDSMKMTKDDLTDMLKGTSYFDDIDVKDSETARKYVDGVCKALGCGTLNHDIFKSSYLSCSIVSILLKVAEIKKKIVGSSNDVMVAKLKTSLAELVKNNIVPITNKEIQKLNSTK